MAVIVCPNCQHNNEENMRFCVMCGTTLAKYCPNCQFANPPLARYCGMCGTNLSATEGTALLAGARPKPVPASLTVPAETIPTNRPQTAGPFAEITPRELVGERHMATVLLADVQNSTRLMEVIGNEAWVRVMNHIFQVLEAEIYRMGGEIDQYRGDGVLAFFGARSVHEDDPERAVLAALMTQRSFHQFAKQLKKEYPEVDLRLRIGINTGEVIVTSIGSEQHLEKTAMGEAIAVAARMESSAEPGTVLVSEYTYNLTQGQFDYESLGEIEVKGISKPVAVYRPLRFKEQSLRAATRATHWIGRTKVVETLHESILDLTNGNGSIVMINGDKGMGKSYLINHVRQEIRREHILQARARGEETHDHQEPHYWCVGACRSYGQAWPYALWFDLLQFWLRSLQEEHHASASEVFYSFMERHWSQEQNGLVAYLSHFLDLPMEEEKTHYLEQQEAQLYQSHFYEAIREWVQTLTRIKPLVLVFSNLHWCDEPSLDLLKFCLPLSDSVPVMWLMTMRPVRNSPAWNFRHYLGTEYPHRLVWIEVKPMTADEGNQLIDQILGSDSLDKDERDYIYQRSEGNPYYLREILFTMIDKGVLAFNEESGTYALDPNRELNELPDSLQGILQEYIANLSAEERHVLQVASVMGTRFWHTLLLRMLSMDEETLNRHLTGLQRHQLIREEFIEEDMGMRFTFVSTLMREAAYESLLKPQRSAYHRQCGEIIEQWLEEHANKVSNLNQIYAYLAHHFEMAGVAEKQMIYHVKAAEIAENLHANEEALYHLDQALKVNQALAEGVEGEERKEILRTRFDILSQRRWLRLMMADVRGSQEDAEAVLRLTEEELAGEPSLRIDAILMFAYPSTFSLFTVEESERMGNMCEEALYLSRKLEDRQREMETLVKITFLRANASNQNVYEPAMQALSLARELGDVNMEFNILLNFGYYLLGYDQTDEGMRYVDQALTLSDRVDDPLAQMNVLSVIGPSFERTGDYHRWLVEYEEKRLELSRQIGSRIAEGNSLMNCGMIRAIYLGDYDLGLEQLKESIRLLGSAPSRLFAMLRLAQAYVELDNQEKAQVTLDESQPLTVDYTMELARVGYQLVQIMLNNEQDDLQRLMVALELAQDIDRLALDHGISHQYRMAAASHASSVHRKLAALLGSKKNLRDEEKERRQYHLDQSLATAELSVSIYEDYGYTNASEITGEWILYRMGQALIARGRRNDALPFIRRAHEEMMRKHDLIPEGSPLRRTFLENIRHHRQIQAAFRLLTF